MCWIIGCIISLLCCAYLIFNVWNKWTTSPVILTFNQEQTPIWEIPFPAVTICPTSKIDQQIYNYTKLFLMRDKLNYRQRKKFWDVSLTCDLELMDEVFDKRQTMNFTDEDVYKNIKSVNRGAFISNIKWLSTKIPIGNVSDFFAEQITEEGICYTFNSLSLYDMYTDETSETMDYINHDVPNVGWNIETGYPETASFDDYPKRTTDDGFASGLTFWLNTDTQNRDYICGLPFSGFKIILHNPAEPARPGQEYILTSSDQEHTIIVKPEMTMTEPGLVSLHSHTRKCFFSHERTLRYLKVYTLNNCRIECLANLTLHSCGCVPFYLPRAKRTKLCAFGKQDCVTNVRSKVLKYKILNEIQPGSNEELELEIYSKCDCLPPCDSLSFSAETSQSKLHSLTKIHSMDMFNNSANQTYAELGNRGYEIAQIDIFFKEAQFLALHRGELYGSTDFFANIGGLLGLFMGFSVLSLLEIFYFFSIHLWCRLRQVNNK